VEAPTDGSYWVVPARLLAGSYVRDVDALLAAGVTLFVDLTEDGELAAYSSGVRAPMRHVRAPIRDFSVPSREAMRRTLDMIDAELAAGGVVYVHCRGGCGRTGMVVGCHLVRRGLAGEVALARVEELCGGSCPETDEQRAMVLGWRVGE
jgi:Swiss Army Knife protein, DSP-PTPase phosphatase domain